MNSPESIEHLDREQVFYLFATFSGDPVRTGAALNIAPAAVLRLADADGWLKKLEPIIALSKTGRAGDFEKSLNRSLNLVQAHRMRLILERTIKKLTGFTDAELEDSITEIRINKDGVKIGSKLSTRALADLSSALEKVHSLTYQALGDTAPERAKRKAAEEDGDSVQDIHVKLAQAMSAAGMSQTPRALLFDAQLAQGEALTAEIGRKAVRESNAASDPNNDDDH